MNAEMNAEMKQNHTPTFADLAPMLANAVQEYGIVTDDTGHLKEEDTAQEFIGRFGDFAEELAFANISSKRLDCLMLVVNESLGNALSMPIRKRETVREAAAGLREIVKLWGLIKDFSPELNQFHLAVTAYTKARDEADSDGPTEGAKSHEHETTTDNAPKQ